MTNICLIVGGNQRELARAKNQKKQQEQAKKKTGSGGEGLSLEQRKQRFCDFEGCYLWLIYFIAEMQK